MKSGVKVTRKVRVLRPILERWVALNRELALRWRDAHDAPWWYGERASISVLAGAIWKEGGYSFEEYASVKRRKKKLWAGRLDLEFSFGKQAFVAEAKQCWIPQKTGHMASVRQSMRHAVDDVRRCSPFGMRKLAVVFGVPKVASKHESELDARIDGFIAHALEVHAHAVAWMFPEKALMPSINSKIYPGVIAWIKEVR